MHVRFHWWPLCRRSRLMMSKRKNYNEGNLQSAVGAVRKKLLTASQASREFGVPRQTIADHSSGKLDNFGLSGPGNLLTSQEEQSLVDYVQYMGQRGFPLNRGHLKTFVTQIVQISGRDVTRHRFNKENGPSDRWCRDFMDRNPILKEKIPQQRDKGRTRMSNSTIIDGFFKKYDEVLDELNLKGKHAQIFNCDETGFTQKDSSKRRVLGLNGQPCFQQQISTVDHVTAHVCVAADGRVLPTFIIFQKGLPHRPYREDVPRSWLFGVSESGYMDRELFSLWFEKIFLKNCGSERPVLLILDNHDSHISIGLIEMARKNQVTILGLPAHTTHLLQPCDVLLFGHLKEKMRSLATSMSLVNSSMVVSKAKFPALLSYAIDSLFSPAFVKSSFRKSGLAPYDPNAIDKSLLVPEDFQKNTSNGNETEKDHDPKSLCEDNICKECGKSNAPHPILAVQQLPLNLQALFVVPKLPNKKEKCRKIVTDARVISGEDMLNQLKEKEREEKEKRESIEKKRQEREKKKQEREMKKSGNGKRKAKRKEIWSEFDDEEDQCDVCRKKDCVCVDGEDESVVCPKCMQRDPVQEDEESMTSWVCCEECEKWFHDVCVGVTCISQVFICEDC